MSWFITFLLTRFGLHFGGFLINVSRVMSDSLPLCCLVVWGLSLLGGSFCGVLLPLCLLRGRQLHV